MSKYLTGSGTINHELIGKIKYVVRTNSRHIVARWHSDALHVSIPPYATVDEVFKSLDQMQERILARKPKESPYKFGKTLDFDDFTIKICGMDNFGNRCAIYKSAGNLFEIRLDKALDISSTEVIKAISNAMRGIARNMAPKLLLPRAKELAEATGAHPSSWEISSGVRVLGHCNSKRVIALSYTVVFLPKHLRDYIIYHELAHLTEMNHSAEFHKICNRYCGGYEKQYIKELKGFRFPIV